jgi:CPA1 family monovalent cation:H+ antiporter
VARDGSPIPERDVLLAVTYLIVVFSIAVQGLTIGSVVKHALAASEDAPAEPEPGRM